MRRWMIAPVFFAAAFGMTASTEMPRAKAQAKPAPPAVPPVVETIRTADGMKLSGLFHETKTPKPGNNTGSSPVVLLLYAPGVDHSMAKGDWESLANTLNAEGFNVMRFDWRGHGKSTDITDPLGNMMNPGFWNNQYTGPWNTKYIKGANKKPVKNDFKVNELSNVNYYPTYVQDLAAVRVHLDQKNDQKSCNTSSIYIIGAEEAAPLALMWLTAEWNRPGIHPLFGNGLMYTVVPMPGVQNAPEGGKDIAGAVWLSGCRPPNGVTSINEKLMQQWVNKTLDLRLSNPMLFLYGDMDTERKNGAKMFYEEVLVAQGAKGIGVKPLEQTFVREVKGANKLRGVALLGQNNTLKTEDTIIAYLKQLEKERGNVVPKNRNFVTPYYINMSAFGVN